MTLLSILLAGTSADMKSLTIKVPMILMLGFLILATFACKVGVRSKMVQLCINGEEDMETIGQMIKETALLSGMEFHENGQYNNKAARAQGRHPGYKLLGYSASRSDGLGISVTNSGLSSHEAMVGFSRGSDPEEFQDMFDGFVRSLNLSWQVRDVPEEHGALKSPQCSTPRSANLESA